VFDKHVHPPVVAVGVAVERLVVAGFDNGQRVPGTVFIGGQFGFDVGGHPLNVVHQLFRLLEYIVIDPLKNIADKRAALIVFHRVRIVDMAGTVRLGHYVVAGNLIMRGDFADFFLEHHNE